MTKHILRIFTIIGVISLCAVEASAMSDFTAKIRVSGGGTYDYCVIGMNQAATDGFDNAYDALAPGFNMNDTYLSCVISHPDWNTVKIDFRGDIRATKPSETWSITVRTNLPAGTPLTMEVEQDGNSLPQNALIVVDDAANGKRADLTAGPYEFSSTGSTMSFTIAAGSKKVDAVKKKTGEGGKKQKGDE
jgi:hypothetical protein